MWDAYLLYDLPGVEFHDGRAHTVDPSPELMRGFEELAENGHGFVVMHHAIAGWPTWTAWGEAIGARFHYLPGFYGGREYPDSGYRFDTWHRVSVCSPRHPVATGLGEGFDIVDELYLFPVDEHRVTAILKSDYDFTDTNFSSAVLGVAGRRGRQRRRRYGRRCGARRWLATNRRNSSRISAFGRGYAVTATRSTTQTSVSLGPIPLPSPCAPQARSGGMIS